MVSWFLSNLNIHQTAMSGLKLTLSSASIHGAISYKWLRPSTPATVTVTPRPPPTLRPRPLRPQIHPSTTTAKTLTRLIRRGISFKPNCVSYSSAAEPHDRGEASSHRILADRTMEPSANGEVDRLLLRDDGDNKDSHQSTKLLTLPTVLTIGRVAAVPLLVSTYFIESWWGPTATTSIFIVAAVTDWLDGYLARKMKQGSAFGAFLDPVADKLMVAATLVLLCTKPLELDAVGQVPWLMTIPAIGIIGREITMSAVREWAASKDKKLLEAVAVNNLGKWKTASQMTALTILLASRDSSVGGTAVVASGVALLYVSAGLALWSLVVYMRKIWKVLVK